MVPNSGVRVSVVARESGKRKWQEKVPFFMGDFDTITRDWATAAGGLLCCTGGVVAI
jgi:hypothetical protein